MINIKKSFLNYVTVFRIPQNSTFIEASPSDCLVL